MNVKIKIISSLQIVDIQRPIEVPQEGLLCDILWSDPDKVCMYIISYLLQNVRPWGPIPMNVL